MMIEVDYISNKKDLVGIDSEQLKTMKQQAWDLMEDYKEKFMMIDKELLKRGAL
jgi:hypothetical protein